MIKIIAAITADRGAIGAGGDMLYHVSEDLRRFRRLTTGHTVIMGRKTFESLPKGALPDRRNIVVSHNPDFKAEGVETAPDIASAIGMAGDDEIYIIGGGQIYAQSIGLTDTLELTMIGAPTPDDADTFFPEIDPGEWELEQTEDPAIDAKSKLPYRFITLRRTKDVKNGSLHETKQ